MDSSKLSLLMVLMVSAVAARLIPNGDVDEEDVSDYQDRLDRQDYALYEVHKPAILATGICAQSPSLPCCKETIEFYELLQRPAQDLSYPNCRSDGYYAAKQCNWAACYCVDPNGNSVAVPTQRPKNAPYYDHITCPDFKEFAVESPPKI